MSIPSYFLSFSCMDCNCKSRDDKAFFKAAMSIALCLLEAEMRRFSKSSLWARCLCFVASRRKVACTIDLTLEFVFWTYFLLCPNAFRLFVLRQHAS